MSDTNYTVKGDRSFVMVNALRKKEIPPNEIALLCAQLASNYRAEKITVLDVENICSYADFFVICSGRSSRQVQGIADNIEEELRKLGIKPLGIEGWREGLWVLMDYGDVIVHIFYDPVRDVYDLEGLWAEARNVQINVSGD